MENNEHISSDGYYGSKSNTNIFSGINDMVVLMQRKQLFDVSLSSSLGQFSKEDYVVILEPLFEHILVDLLLCNKNRPRRVVIVEHLISTKNMREAIAKVLFESRKVPSLMFVPTLACPTFLLPPPPLSSLSLSINVVLDVGYSESRCCVVCNGNPLINTFYCSTGYGDIIRELLTKMEKEAQMTLTYQDASYVLENLTEYLFKPEAPKSIETDKSRSCPLRIPSSGQMETIPLNILEAVWESSLDSIALSSIKSMYSCPIDIKKAAAQSIVVVGGGSMFNGFCDKLRTKILDLIRSNDSKWSALEKVFEDETLNFKYLPFARDKAIWIGASIFGAMSASTNDGRWVSRENWTQSQEQSIFDWANVSRSQVKQY